MWYLQQHVFLSFSDAGRTKKGGENLEKSRCKMQLCKQLGIPTRRISGEKRIGTKILKSESLAWNLTLRKTRRYAFATKSI
jgi:hypothetical protein